MDDKEAIELYQQAFLFGQKMRAAIANNDNEERKVVRTEWEIFHGENSEHHATIFMAYRNGMEKA